MCACLRVYSLFDWSDTSPADQLESLEPRRLVCNGFVKCSYRLGGGDVRPPPVAKKGGMTVGGSMAARDEQAAKGH